jgi:hypothetical protein
MKIFVAYNDQGKVLAAVATEAGSQIRGRLDAKLGAFVEELEMPAEFSRKALRECLPHLRVDVAARRLIKVHGKAE